MVNYTSCKRKKWEDTGTCQSSSCSLFYIIRHSSGNNLRTEVTTVNGHEIDKKEEKQNYKDYMQKLQEWKECDIFI